jgi:hypothetical protein
MTHNSKHSKKKERSTSALFNGQGMQLRVVFEASPVIDVDTIYRSYIVKKKGNCGAC